MICPADKFQAAVDELRAAVGIDEAYHCLRLHVASMGMQLDIDAHRRARDRVERIGQRAVVSADICGND